MGRIRFRRGRQRLAVATVVLTMTAVMAPGASAAQRYVELVSLGTSGPSGPAVEFPLMSRDGSRVFFTTVDSLSPLDTNSMDDLYESTGGQTTLLSIGPTGGAAGTQGNNVVITPDGSRAYFSTLEPLCCGDVDTAMDVYERAGASLSLISSDPPGGFPSPSGISILAASEDGTRAFLRVVSPPFNVEFYEHSGGTTTRLFSAPPSGPSAVNDFCGISPDGSHFRVRTTSKLDPTDNDSRPDIYERVAGATTLLSTGPTDPGSGVNSTFCSGASSDGLRVFFQTSVRLVAADTDSFLDVYERSAGQTTLLSTGPSGEEAGNGPGFCAVSADGERVLFQSEEPLVASDTNAGTDLYERAGGNTQLFSAGPGPGPGASGFLQCAGATADGLHAYFVTDRALVGEDGDNTVDLYEHAGGQLRLASDSAPGLGEDLSFIANAQPRGANSVAFHVAEPLLPTDTDGNLDIYEWDGQRLRHVSIGQNGGNGAFDANIATPETVSEDGSTVLFVTEESLVAGDSGNTYDLYAARPVPSDDETQTVGPGDTVSTGGTPTPDDPVETSVTTPDGGDVTIVEEESSGPPAGFVLVGMQVDITAPAATAPASLELQFRLDGSLLAPLGLDHTTVLVFKDGSLVAECTTTVPADPDPCVADRTALAGGGAEITVRTTSASLWQFGEEAPSDTTAPVIMPSVTGTFGLNGWYTSDVDVSWTVEDPESAISAQTGCGPTTISSDTAGTELTCEATSGGGTDSESVTIKRDATSPGLTCQAATFLLGGPGGTVSATVTDDTSGPANSSVGAAASVSTAGVKSVTLTSSDLAGNQASKSCSYVVAYGFPGFSSPTANASYKAGSSIPIKFALTNAAGTPISDASAQALANACGVKVSFSGGDPSPNCAIYDAKADRFQFDLKTAKSLRGAQTITVRVFVGTGLVNTQSVVVQLKA